MFPVASQSPFATWQVGVVRPPIWLRPRGGGKPSRVWIAACLNVDSMKVMTSEPGTQEDLRDNLEVLLSRAGWKWRVHPARVQATDPELAGILESLLGAHGVQVETFAELEPLGEILGDLAERLAPDDARPSPLTGTGVTVERLRAFARAAAHFFASRCWHHLTGGDLIRVEAPAVEDELRHFNMTRTSGKPSGMLFFPEAEDFEMLQDGEVGEMIAAGSWFWHVGFDLPWEAPAADLELWEQFDLPWCGEERCPVALLLGDDFVERPDKSKLAFFEGLLAALAATAEAEIDAGRWEKRVATADGPMDFVLALPGLLEPDEDRRAPSAFSWQVTERPMRQIGKLLQGRDFASLEEANEFLARTLEEGLPAAEPETPEERAEELMDRAWEAPGRRAVLLARQALEVWPDCADAYNLLALRAADPEDSRELYERGVAAGERALGPEVFREEAGRFWGLLETRPYMRARQGLAEALVELQRFDEATEHFRDLLRLNPNDNQGVRDSLVNLLIAADRDGEAEELLERYREESTATMAYPRALLAFRREGDSFEARGRLTRALQANSFVPGLLLGKRKPRPPADTYAPRSEEEAALYLMASCRTWESTPGALDWLRDRTKLPPKPKGKRSAEKRGKKKRRR